MRRVFLAWAQMEQWIHAIAPELRAGGFGAVTGIARGGLVPALMVSFETGLPVHVLQYDRATQTPRWVGEAPGGARPVLLCEDVAGAGSTLERCIAFVRRDHDVRVVALVSDRLSRVRPDWSQHFEDVQVVFPWERHERVPAHVADWEDGGASGERAMRPDHEYTRGAVDLDGVLLEDLAEELYLHDLEGTLRRRDVLPRAATWPALDPAVHIIVTGRPECDRARTRAWLDRHGLGGYELHCREDSRHAPSALDVARWKGACATARGCNLFLESDARQAVFMAEACAWLRVYWWNQGAPMLVHGARVSL